MSRSVIHRTWTLILTLGVLMAACLTHPSVSRADRFPEETPGIEGSGPPLPGVGDPDVPVNTSLKKSGRGALGHQDAPLVQRPAGDSRYVGASNVWKWRLSVLARALRVYWLR
jgi:hypothetical protein